MAELAGSSYAPQLLRVPYHSGATGTTREFLVYLPINYDRDPTLRWPVLVFLHGGGERGDGLADLDYVLLAGPLGEAWIHHRDLPFVMIGPQLPLFDQGWQAELRVGTPRPIRQLTPPEVRVATERPAHPMRRAFDRSAPVFNVTAAWGDAGFPGSWQLCQDDVIAMLDHVLATYRTDPDRVSLTGLSYGGNGTWQLAVTFPDRWAAIAPVCGDGNEAAIGVLAQRQLPIWMFHGGRDRLNKPQWAYDLANALERAGHTNVQFTVHEDCGHDCWTRVYSGDDLYTWLLRQRRPAR
jgi:predicted peptidase